MELRDYELVFILTPVLSEEQITGNIEKYVKFLTDAGSEITHQYKYKLQRLAYPIQKKNTGVYQILEFKALPTIINKLEREFNLDDNILRYLVISLDKHGIEYNKQKRESASDTSKVEKKDNKSNDSNKAEEIGIKTTEKEETGGRAQGNDQKKNSDTKKKEFLT